MKVVVSVGGRFHAFNLAAELERQGYLKKLVTSYPAFAAKRFGVSPENVVSVPSKEVLARAWHKMPAALRNRFDPDFWLAEYFDKAAARRIPEGADLFVGWSYFSLHALRKAKQMGMVTVIDHGSAHIEYQRDILNDEYGRWGLQPPMRDPRPVQKELKEYAEADYIAVGSKFAARTFVEKGIPKEKLLHVPYGVDLSAFHPAAAGDKKDGVFRVLYVGGMTLQKGVHYLLQAFAELDLSRSELLLVGGMHPEMQPFLQKYRKHVRAIGPVPQSELPQHYAHSSAFVLNSVQDGFGMVIMQAMASGLPVIATENTGGPDVIRDGEDGYIIPIRDVGALKAKLKYLHDHPELCARMGRSAAERAASGFTWADYGRRMAAEYERILQKS